MGFGEGGDRHDALRPARSYRPPACRDSRPAAWRSSGRGWRVRPLRRSVGSSSIAASSTSSTRMPPAPTTSARPNCGSRLHADDQLGDDVADHALDQHLLDLARRAGSWRPIAPSAPAPPRHRPATCRLTATAPASVLCAISGSATFSTTGKPSVGRRLGGIGRRRRRGSPAPKAIAWPAASCPRPRTACARSRPPPAVAGNVVSAARRSDASRCAREAMRPRRRRSAPPRSPCIGAPLAAMIASRTARAAAIPARSR